MMRKVIGLIMAAAVLILMGCPNVPNVLPTGDNADLTALTVSEGALSPVFSAGNTAYTVNVDYSVTNIMVSGTPADGNVSMSTSHVLNLGDTAITITVTAGNGITTKDYVVTVNRSADYTSVNIGSLKCVPTGSFQRDIIDTNISVITQPFRMSATEITRAQFSAIIGIDPSDDPSSLGDTDPVQNANWYHAIAFSNKLSLAEGLTPVYSVSGVNFTSLTYGNIPTINDTDWNAVTVDWAADGYRLPTEMEWMWAAMGATSDRTNGYSGTGINTTGYTKGYAGSMEVGSAKVNIGSYAWYNVNSDSTTHPAGSRLPNELGLFDMSGNVIEWNWDWYASDPGGTIESESAAGRGAASGTARVVRGGSWFYDTTSCTVFFRGGTYIPVTRMNYLGFRVVRR